MNYPLIELRTGAAIGIGIGGLILAIMVGIAALPDEVLLESSVQGDSEKSEFTQPAAIEDSPPSIQQIPVQPTEVVLPPTPEEVPTKPEIENPPEEEVSQPTPPVEPSPSSQEEPPEQPDEEESRGNVIKIQLSDGVGSKDK